jgi:hypothetical protein
MMWNDPWLDMQLHQLDYEQRLNATAWRWSMRCNDVPPAEPIPLRDWLALFGEFWVAICPRNKHKASSKSPLPMTKATTLREMHAYPLHQLPEKRPPFSLN